MAEFYLKQNSSRRDSQAKFSKISWRLRKNTPNPGKVEILEAIESENYKREFNVDGQYKGEINKAIDEKTEI